MISVVRCWLIDSLPKARSARQGLATALLFILSGCVAFPERDGPPQQGGEIARPAQGVPGPEPRSRYGNPEFYEVAGQRYFVMDSAKGYRERGVASWYGSKFHGKRTSSGEPYDMYALSAAHKSLPLPTWVRVTHLGNGRSLVIRVNDRGPFVDDRIIDLSFAAARELDMVAAGTALVEIEVLDFTSNQQAGKIAQAPAQHSAQGTPQKQRPLFLQTGAFSEAINANRQRERLESAGIERVTVNPGTSGDGSATLYRVQIGPIADVAQFDRIQQQLRQMGIDSARLVSVE
ncbi:MAG: septal ring lytic transglycosylase RlpA family protein [Pseudomonadota bacterium]